jgi:hypothetical protein
MSKRSSGTAFQLWCKKWLEEYFPGVVVHNQPMNHVMVGPGKWICKENDVLGCIDLIAIHPGQPPLFIQVSMDEHTTKRLDKFAKVPWNLTYCTVQLWIKRPTGIVSIKQLESDVLTGKVFLTDHSQIVRRKYERI